ncbi:small, acid-soluble spore protein Tlp [Halobacillus andaensis]|uniref:Small, acid-soluble spore protein Tlp n=1 Tax=Halobacillus andaensis TaxID=1176239 RepID=A0A917EV03_HALAA|nr:small acid-soluble spore protein Tlp [Halobacillus andaensis]MBP2003389.1 small acid-soluble spore protein (thioredoxin-like protein) [Halobacillus andaensis]GGF10268.1 small, acid-soluble spore protein Tlp [Halobacillus andaensis]
MSKQKPNPDNREDNVERLQEAVQNTIENIEASHETMSMANEKDKAQIERKNKKREESLEAMRQEISDEARHQE